MAAWAISRLERVHIILIPIFVYDGLSRSDWVRERWIQQEEWGQLRTLATLPKGRHIMVDMSMEKGRQKSRVLSWRFPDLVFTDLKGEEGYFWQDGLCITRDRCRKFLELCILEPIDMRTYPMHTDVDIQTSEEEAKMGLFRIKLCSSTFEETQKKQ